MRTVILRATAVFLILCFSLDAYAAVKKKKKRAETVELPEWEVIEDVVNEGGELKAVDVVAPPSAESYALLLLREEGEVAYKEEGPLDGEEVTLSTVKKSILEGAVGLVAAFTLGAGGGAVAVRTVKGDRDRAMDTSLAGIGLASSAGGVPAVYLVGRYLFKDRGSLWGTLIGGIGGSLLGAVVSYPFRDFTAPTFIIPIFTAAGSALGYRYLLRPPLPPPLPAPASPSSP